MSERGEWFVCLVREECVRGLYEEVLEYRARMWRKREPWRPGVEKCVVRFDRPLTLEYVRKKLVSAMSVGPWRGETEYMASMETRAATMEKLRKEYVSMTSFTHLNKYNYFHPYTNSHEN